MFRSPRGRIKAKIRNARKRARVILKTLKSYDKGELDVRDSILMQQFIMEQMSPLKRFALEKVITCVERLLSRNYS